MSEGTSGEVQRWTAKRRAALVVSIMKGETSVAEAARQHGLKVSEIEDWQEKFMLAAENALRSRPREEEALKDEQIKQLKQKVGELVLDLDIVRTANRLRPSDPTTFDDREKRCQTSPSVGFAKSWPYRARRSGPSRAGTALYALSTKF